MGGGGRLCGGGGGDGGPPSAARRAVLFSRCATLRAYSNQPIVLASVSVCKYNCHIDILFSSRLRRETNLARRPAWRPQPPQQQDLVHSLHQAEA